MNGYEYIVEYLRSEGFRFTEEDNHFFLKYQGANFIFFKNDSPFVQITQILNVEGQDYDRCLRLCNDLNGSKFVVKLTVTNNNTVWCSYEFIPNDATPTDEYNMIFDYLDKVSDEFFDKLSHGDNE